jgi:hypothetical protein
MCSEHWCLLSYIANIVLAFIIGAILISLNRVDTLLTMKEDELEVLKKEFDVEFGKRGELPDEDLH